MLDYFLGTGKFACHVLAESLPATVFIFSFQLKNKKVFVLHIMTVFTSRKGMESGGFEFIALLNTIKTSFCNIYFQGLDK